MSCVTFVKIAILWNWETLDEFTPGRGLRQGDPLSPYLFVVCMERLSLMIRNKAEEGGWKGIKVSINTSPLTHLFFVGDLILFGQDNMSIDKSMMDVLNDFCLNSGQIINLSKSKFLCPPMFVEIRHRELVIIVGSNFLTTWVSTWGFLFSIKEYKILTISLKKSRVGLLVGCLTPLCFLARLPWSNLFPLQSPVTLCKPCSFLLQCVIDWTG